MGWPTRMYGAEAGKLPDLPVVVNPAEADKPWGPGDAGLPDRRLDELPAIGINLLQNIRGKDYCVLLGGVSVAKPTLTTDVGPQQAGLGSERAISTVQQHPGHVVVRTTADSTWPDRGRDSETAAIRTARSTATDRRGSTRIGAGGCRDGAGQPCSSRGACSRYAT